MKSCMTCGREDVLRRGRCDRCRQYLAAHGHERPVGLEQRQVDGHYEALKLWPAPLGDCENGCGDEAVERHHVDEDPTNNVRENVRFLCRRCHMTIDGRRGRQPAPCQNCGMSYKPLRRGRCNRCRSWLGRYGEERPMDVKPRNEKPTPIVEARIWM